ncbi:MAG: hypothetical protein NWE84_04580 [Candidatus Bathyarchaeota archaeon]|nr:hypothetical protein [Candidatus Bathyarchaeota archaeon]
MSYVRRVGIVTSGSTVLDEGVIPAEPAKTGMIRKINGKWHESV